MKVNEINKKIKKEQKNNMGEGSCTLIYTRERGYEFFSNFKILTQDSTCGTA